MLQITSGKFYDPAKGTVETPSQIILYSNLGIYIPMEAMVGRLERLQHERPFSQYAFKYVHKLEQEEGKVRPVMMSEEPISEHLCGLLTVFFKAYFSPKLESVEILCSASSPEKLVHGYFDTNRHVEMRDQGACQTFLDDVVALSRKDYLAVVSCAMAVQDALEALHTNPDLAYSLLVFAAECLAQRLDNYVPEWEHHPKRSTLDPILVQIPNDRANEIRAELIADANFRSMQRFIGFMESNLMASFFVEEAGEVKTPLRKSESRSALTKVYTLRSKYAHELQEIQQHLKVPQIAEAEVFHWYNEPFLTFNGLLRLITHVLKNFVAQTPKVAFEAVNWRDQLPGTIKLFWSPEYYIFRESDVAANDAQRRLEGFLSLLSQLWVTGDNKIAEFRPVLEQFRNLFPQADQRNKRAIYVLLDLWNALYTRYPVSEAAIAFLENNRDVIIATCTSEGMIWAGIREEEYWTADEMATVFNQYEKRRVIPKGTSFPHTFELLMMFKIAFRFQKEGNDAEYRAWLQRIILEAPGIQPIQQAAQAALDGASCPTAFSIIFPPKKKQSLDYSI